MHPVSAHRVHLTVAENTDRERFALAVAMTRKERE
jgi:hypothetical protein